MKTAPKRVEHMFDLIRYAMRLSDECEEEKALPLVEAAEALHG